MILATGLAILAGGANAFDESKRCSSYMLQANPELARQVAVMQIADLLLVMQLHGCTAGDMRQLVHGDLVKALSAAEPGSEEQCIAW